MDQRGWINSGNPLAVALDWASGDVELCNRTVGADQDGG